MKSRSELRRWVALTAIFCASALSFSLSSQATSFIERPLAETVADSPTMVRGKVGGSTADYGSGPGGGRRIYTIYDVNVTEVLKGKAPSGRGIQVRELGGEKDGIGMQVAGAAHFERGEDVVLTLSERNPDGTYDLRGLSSGKYLVRQDENGQDYIVGSGAPGPLGGGQSATGVKNLVTLDVLRDIIKKQGGAPQVSTIASEKSPSPAAPKPVPSSAEQQAPRLQPEKEVEPESNSGFGSGTALAVALGLGAIGAGVFWVIRRSR